MKGKNLRILILDDDDKRHLRFSRGLIGHEVRHAMTYRQAVNALAFEDPFDVVFLDYDLNDYNYISVDQNGQLLTGFEVAKNIAEEMKVKPPKIIVHSLNPAGGDGIVEYLKDRGLNVIRWLFDKNLKGVPL